jgi:Fe-S oxidoreductase
VAGNFGFEREHYEVSMQVAGHALAPALRGSGPDAVVLTDGFSCSLQVRQLQPDRAGRHLAQLLDPGPSAGA